MYGYIYRITDLTNGKCYIGQHKYDKPELDPKYKGSGYITNKLWKLRPETLLMEYIMTCATLEELNYFETYFIEHMNTMVPNGYNLNTGGNQYKASEETLRKKSEALKGENNPFYGKTHSEETKRKLREAAQKRTGENNPMFGKTHSEEARKKQSEARKGTTLSEEHKRRISESGKGIHKGKHWYNNGQINVFCKECPEGFVPGMLQNKHKNNE